MDYLTGVRRTETLEISELTEKAKPGQKVRVNGAVYTIRHMGTVAFVILRKREGLIQGVYEEGIAQFRLKDVKEAAAVEIEGVLEENQKAPNGIEIRMEKLKVLSEPAADRMPLAVSKWKLKTSLEAKLNYRSISLRNVRERAKFRIQEGLTRAFRDFLYGQGFTEIHTPKIGAKGAEGGANIFKLDYFHRPAVLAQSPQFYKQMMVGVFDRVFDIDGFEDIMAMETGYLQYAMELLAKDYYRELKILDITLPEVKQIPAVKFGEIKEAVSERYGHKMKNPFDLEPEEEQLISRYAKEEWGSDFVFVTHYPSKKRPFYAMDDPEDTRYTLSFDLLFRGMEITTGGQRIHDYHVLTEKIAARGMTEEGMEDYLDTFRYGMPPHGGLGIGLERLTMKLVGEDNVRETTLFPRDLSRLEP